MDAIQPTVDQELLETLRRRRAELRESLNALEQALAASPLSDPTRWCERVHVAVVELAADFREHIDVTEGPGGLYQELQRTAPWLSGPVHRLADEHGSIRQTLEDLLSRCEGMDASPEEVRDTAVDLLGKLVHHRQRGADLVFEACEVDIGGET